MSVTIDECRFRRAICHTCEKPGPIATDCRSAAKTTFHLDAENTNINPMELYSINNFSNYSNDPVICSIEINNVHHNFELDSGAAVTAVSEKYYAAHFGKNRIVPDSTRLQGYGNEEIQVSGAIFPIVKFNDRLREFKILIVKNGGPPIVGRELWYYVKCK